MVRTYKIFATITASGNALAQVDVRRNGAILGVQLSLAPAATPANNDNTIVEISLYPSSQVTTNDAMGVLAYGSISGAILTSGSVQASNVYVPSYGIRVQVGDRLYLHASEAGGQSVQAMVLVHVDEV